MKRAALIALTVFAIACSKPEKKEYFSIIDFSAYQEELINASSIEENKRLDSIIFDQIEQATVNRYLPPLIGSDLEGKEVRVDQLIKKPTLIVFFSPFCGWTSVDLANELPEIIDGAESRPEVIVLLLEERRGGIELPEDFYKVQHEQLKFLYPNTFLIQGTEAQKLNMYALPSRFYFNGDKKLLQLTKGRVSVNRVKKEIAEFYKILE